MRARSSAAEFMELVCSSVSSARDRLAGVGAVGAATARALASTGCRSALTHLPTPGVDPLLYGDPCDAESDQRVEPPQSEQRVARQPDQDCRRQGRADQVLGALAGGGAGAEPGA